MPFGFAVAHFAVAARARPSKGRGELGLPIRHHLLVAQRHRERHTSRLKGLREHQAAFYIDS
jgi:hypothetical protein